jgi:CHAD domain-containing protein
MNPLAGTEISRLERLTTGLAERADLDLAIHTTRKGIKRLRAFLRLARRSIGTTTYRIENGALRETARLLAPARDAYMLIDTARDLDASDLILSVLQGDYSAAMQGFVSLGRLETVHRLEAITGRWRLLTWHGPDSKSIGAGILRTYRRGLVDLETVRATPTAAAFHGWRRRVKYLRYQLEVLDVPRSFLHPYTALGDDLGLEHDQTVLLDVCKVHADNDRFASLALLSTERRYELRASALERGALLFDQEPESFRRTVEEMIGIR